MHENILIEKQNKANVEHSGFTPFAQLEFFFSQLVWFFSLASIQNSEIPLTAILNSKDDKSRM